MNRNLLEVDQQTAEENELKTKHNQSPTTVYCLQREVVQEAG